MEPYPYNTSYLITKDGRVWSKKRGKFLSLCPDTNGYPVVLLYHRGRRIMKRVHRLVLETYIGDCPKGMETRHLDGNPQNNNLENLQWGTHRDNENDRIEHNRRNYKTNGRAKLCLADIPEIKKMYFEGRFQKEIARIFGVGQAVISRVIRGQSWACIRPV